MISISPVLAWFIGAAIVLAVELMIGTTFLLAVVFGLAVTGLAAWIGLSFSWQLFICAITVAAGCIGVFYWRKRRASKEDPSVRLQNLDEGQCVTVDVVGTDGLAVVRYRGATWIARAADNKALTPGRWVIAQVDGAQLVLAERIKQ